MSDVLKPEILRQRAVYWQHVGDDDFGQQTFKKPVEIKCRWEDKDSTFTDPAGRTSTAKSMVYVDRDLEPSSVLMLGRLATFNQTDLLHPKNFPEGGAWEVKRVFKLPNGRCTKFLRWVLFGAEEK